MGPMPDTTTILVTGATSGLGLSTARELARQGKNVIVTGRSAASCEAAAAEVSASGWLAADFADLYQVAALADEFKHRFGRLDVLVNNAGAVFQQRRLTAQGFEMTFAVNHLAPFLLTTRLLDTLNESAPARIVNVASVAHAMEHLDIDDLQLARGYRPFRAYGRTKLANVMFTYELARRLAGTGVTANAVHPGLVRTGIGAKGGRLTGVGWSLTQWRYRRALVEPDQAAQTVVKLASSPETEGVSGAYFDGLTQGKSSEESRDPAAWARLWTASEELLQGVKLPGTTSG
jgi:NAD(P)-dependent dehydrogenase (short-subunit alcohol dehydrogenase family)